MRGRGELDRARRHAEICEGAPNHYPEIAPAIDVPKRYRRRLAREARAELEAMGFEFVGYSASSTPAMTIVTEQLYSEAHDVFAGLMVRGDWIAFTVTSVYFASRFGGHRVLFTSAGDMGRTEHSSGNLIKHGRSGSMKARFAAHLKLLERVREVHGPPRTARSLDDRIEMMRQTERWYWEDEGDYHRERRMARYRRVMTDLEDPTRTDGAN